MAKSKQLFQLEGQFLGFAANQKSPFAYLLLSTAAAGGDLHTVKLSSSLRLILFRHLQEGDWLRIVGTEKIDKQTLEPYLKAQEVLRLAMPTSPSRPRPPRPAKILVCSGSACSGRGAQAVLGQLESKLASSGLEGRIEVRSTGCMGRCKAGPHVVFDRQCHSRITSAEQLDSLVDPYFARCSAGPSQDTGAVSGSLDKHLIVGSRIAVRKDMDHLPGVG